MNGDCVTDLSACLDEAGPEEAVMSAAAFAQIAGPGLITEAIGVNAHHKIISVSSETDKLCIDFLSMEDSVWGKHHGIAGVMSFIPTPVLIATSAQVLDTMSELRTVTTMFVKMDNYSPTDNVDCSSLHPYLLAMQECLAECGGFLRQFLVDDKGCVLIGLWGVPHATYANNCSRALRCAAMMSIRAKGLEHSISVGIATGTTYCGLIGSECRRDYVAIGKSVNLAARLMGNAHGSILVDTYTLDHLPMESSQHLSKKDTPLQLKGFAEPVDCYALDFGFMPLLSSDDTLPPKDPKLFHNRNLLSKMESALNLASAMHPCNQQSESFDYTTSLFVIKSLAGMGKTTAASVFAHKCRKKLDIPTTYLHLNPSHSSSPYHAMRALFYDLVGESNFKTVEQQQNLIAAILQKTYPSELFTTPNARCSARVAVMQKVLGFSWSSPTTNSDEIRLPAYSPTADSQASYSFLSRSPSSHRVQPFALLKAGSNSASATVWNLASAEGDEYEDTFVEVLHALMHAQIGRVVVVDNAHYMHMCSWQLLVRIFELNAHCMFVLTMASSDLKKDKVEREKLDRERFSSSIDSHPSTPSSRRSRSSVRNTRFLAKSASLSISSAIADDSALATGSANEHVVHYQRLVKACRQLVEVCLEPLSKYMVSSFLAVHLDKEDISSSVLDEVYRISEGNPFWCWKIVHFIKEMGSPEVFASMLKYNNDGLVVCVLDKFTAVEQAVVRYASVIGEEFKSCVLEAVLPSSMKSMMNEALTALVREGLLYVIAPGSYSFQSSLIRKLSYSLIPPR
jgi:class 3 adenylate cyclase